MSIIVLALLLCIVNAISTVVGFGTGTLLIPILINYYSIGQTYLLVGILQWFSSLWKYFLFRKHGIDVSLFFRFAIPSVIGTIIGSIALFSIKPLIFYYLLGIFLILYGLYLMYNPHFALKQHWYTIAIGGSFIGFIAGFFGARGPLRGTFLSLFNLPKHTYLATSGAIGLLLDSVRLIIYFIGGMRMESTYYWWSLLFLIPIEFLGAKMGQKLVKYISQKTFRICVAIFLIAVGIRLFFK